MSLHALAIPALLCILGILSIGYGVATNDTHDADESPAMIGAFLIAAGYLFAILVSPFWN